MQDVSSGSSLTSFGLLRRRPQALPTANTPQQPVRMALLRPPVKDGQTSKVGVRGQSVGQGNESRLTRQRAQYRQQVFGIPSGAFAAALDGSFIGDLAHQIEGEVSDHGHVLGAMTGAQA